MASSSAARRASYGFAYCGFSTIGVGGGGFSLGSAPRPARYGAHTPDRSGGVCAETLTAQRTSTSRAGPLGPADTRALTAVLRPGRDRCPALGRHAASLLRAVRQLHRCEADSAQRDRKSTRLNS